MNKQNSMAIENQLSTEINESTKSYSSRFRQFKAIKSNTKFRYPDVLPFKLEKAAIVIQRFWRHRQIQRKRFYEQFLEQLQISNAILQFQNNNLDNLMEVYERDINQFETYFQASGKLGVEKLQREANLLIRQMAILTFKMQKRITDEKELNELTQHLREARQRNYMLEMERQGLKQKLSGELQEEQSQFLRKIKEQNMNLLRVSKQKHQAEKMMREKMIQTCRNQMKM